MKKMNPNTELLMSKSLKKIDHSSEITNQNYPLQRSHKNKQMSKTLFSSNTIESNDILYYKYKAHQSFMQIQQIQQLHDEQLDQYKEEYQEKINILNCKIKQQDQLLKESKTQQQLQKIPFTEEFSFDIINFENQKKNTLNDTQIIQYQELLNCKQINKNNNNNIIDNYKKDFMNFLLNQLQFKSQLSIQLKQKLQKKISSIFNSIFNVDQEYQIMIKKYDKLQLNYKQLQQAYQRLKLLQYQTQKQNYLLTQNITKIYEQRQKIQKKICLLQNQNQKLSIKSKKNNNNQNLLSVKLIPNEQSKNSRSDDDQNISNFDLLRKSCKSQTYNKQCKKQWESNQKKNNNDSFNLNDLISDLNESKQRYQNNITQSRPGKKRTLLFPSSKNIEDQKIRKKSVGE